METVQTNVFYGAGGSFGSYKKCWEKKGIYAKYVCDSDVNKHGNSICGLPVLSLEQCLIKADKNENIHFYLTILDSKNRKDIVRDLLNSGVCQENIHVLEMNDPELLREFCADYHIHAMDSYFESAEQTQSIHTFWGDETLFYHYFQMLSLDNVVELACGRGRHVPQYCFRAGKIVLVDILEENIAFCRKRFADFKNISFYVNSGSDLSQLADNEYSALFTYDAMVHFESIDVYHYLQETFRILKWGGRALFHHSNNTFDYKQSFENSISGGRSYMSAQLFAHFAYRAGLTVLEQKIIDWGVPDLDCITIVEKV